MEQQEADENAGQQEPIRDAGREDGCIAATVAAFGGLFRLRPSGSGSKALQMRYHTNCFSFCFRWFTSIDIAELLAEKHQANIELYGISIYYYENETFFRYKDDPIATVWWGPEMDGSNEEIPEKGDFSFHKVWKPIIYSRNAEYSLDTSEIELYSLFQNEYYKISGKYALPRLSRECILQTDDVQVYQEVANRLGVEKDTLIDLRIKVTRYCLRD